jgi:regulator of protease activity HflC (stomatin/prohibitin superfamily)
MKYVYAKEEGEDPGEAMKQYIRRNRAWIGGLVTLLLFAIFLLLLNPFALVGAGERGVKVTLGKVAARSYPEGIHLITPFLSHMWTMDVKTLRLNAVTEVYTRDIQQATIDYVVNYRLIANEAYRMYQEVGMGYQEKIIIPVVEGTTKDVIGKWNAQDLVANRERATMEILEKLREHLSKNYIHVSNFQVTAIRYSSAFEKAIESKVTAEQEALKAKNRTVQIEEEARQILISAQAEAESMAIRANALQKNKALIEYEAVQRWDGHLPQYLMGNSIPFVQLGAEK